MTQEKIARINELSQKSRISELTSEEKAEQASLRKEYIDDIKANLRSQLDSARVLDDDGNPQPLKRK